MTIAINMAPTMSLDRLPPGVIQTIIQYDPDSITEMRFVSVFDKSNLVVSATVDFPIVGLCCEEIYH